MQVRRPTAALAATVGLALLLTGCGTYSRSAPPTGVDELTIPTPSPDPADFVAAIDNRWLPLEQGTVLTYDVDLSSGAPAQRRVSVQSGAEKIDGVETTVVRDQLTHRGDVVDQALLYYAQDREGNVWWFGRRDLNGSPEESWRAGEDGALAGLAMAAEPRRGDGYRPSYLPDMDAAARAEQVATVTDVADDRVEIELGPGGGDDAARESAGAESGAAVTEFYESGVGLSSRVEESTGRIETLTAVVNR